MIKTIKLVLVIFAVTGLLTACGSSRTKEDAAGSDAGSQTSTTDTSGSMDEGTSTSDENAVDLTGVDTVFYFEFDQSILNAEARAALVIHAEALKAEPRNVRIEGHADERGTREYNAALGERRAEAVRNFLILQGVSGAMIESVSYGEESPVDAGSYESAWSKNRRAEIK